LRTARGRCARGGDQIRGYILGGADLPSLRSAYRELIGRPPVPPRKLPSNLENLRYRLLPYLYALAHRAHLYGEPVFPPLVLYVQIGARNATAISISINGVALTHQPTTDALDAADSGWAVDANGLIVAKSAPLDVLTRKVFAVHLTMPFGNSLRRAGERPPAILTTPGRHSVRAPDAPSGAS